MEFSFFVFRFSFFFKYVLLADSRHIRPRKLLWHGSRICNYVGILNQGLRIAPPEAPSSGYLFGKGIYFADRIQKSAPYCQPTRENPTVCDDYGDRKIDIAALFI
jgi:hypothetical protein